MSKIVTKKFSFDVEDLTDIAGFNVYYGPTTGGDLTYESPFVFVPAVVGQLTYNVILPNEVPVTDGQANLGVASVDTEGNISDISQISYFFDFTPPKKPIKARVS